MNFRKRLLILYLLLTVVPFVVLQVNTQTFYLPTITNRVKALFTYNLQQKSENVRRLLTERLGLVSQVSYDQGLADIVEEINRTPDPTSYQRFQMLDLFSRFTINSDLMAGMGFIRKDGLVIGYDRYVIGQSITSFERYGSVAGVIQNVTEAGSMISFPTQTFRISENSQRTIILSVFPSYDLNSNRLQGFFYLLLNEATFQAVLNPSIGDGSGIVARSLIYDTAGRLVSFPDPSAFSQGEARVTVDPKDPARVALAFPELRGRSVGVISLPIPKTDWTISTVYDEESLFSDRTNLIWYTLLVGLVFLASSLVILWLGSRDLVRSFNKLIEQVRVVGNRLDFGSSGPTGDELAFLGEAFARMQERVSGLVNEVNDRNTALLALAEDQRLAEIRALEAQVNPHFLYNTLNTLNWIAIRQGQPEISQGLSDLADIMRYSISQIEVTATLGDETTWLRKYLGLQQLRFRQNFTYTVENSGVPSTFRLYKLLLQPLVENAVTHGFNPNVPGGILEIRFALDDRKRLVATIADNGRGLPASIHENGQPSIGLANLEKRLEAYYRQSAQLSVGGRADGGTIAVLVVPEVSG